MTIDKKHQKTTKADGQLYQEEQKVREHQYPDQRFGQQSNRGAEQGAEQPQGQPLGQLPIGQVKRRFFLLLALAIVLIAVLIWLTLTVLEANNIEPFGEIAALAMIF